MTGMNSTISSLGKSVNEDEDEKYNKENEILRNLGLLSDTSVEPKTPTEPAAIFETAQVEETTPIAETPKLTEEIDINEKYNRENEILKSVGLFEEEKPKTLQTGITEEEDESWINAFKQSIGQPLDAIADTADVFGFKKTAELIQAVSPDVDENYVSAGYRFMNPKEDDFTILGFAPEYIPRAIAEQTGQIAGSMITAAAGRTLGGVIGSAAGPKGTLVGQAVGGLAGPFIFEAMQIAGPAIKERAKNQGREEPSWDDISWGLSTAAGSGALNALGQKYLPGGDKAVGTFVNKFVKGATSEGVTETAQSLLQQTGETLLTEKGLEIKPKEAIGEGLIGAGAGGTFAAALSPLTGKEEVKPTEEIEVEEQEAILPKPPITEEERGVVSIRVTPKIQAIEEEARREEEARAKVVPTTETDATKSATERLKTKSKELEQKNIPNEALKVVEAQIEQIKPTAIPAAKRAEDILNEKRPLIERQDIKPIDLDETTLSKLKRAADNTADDATISELKDKGLVYEVEGNNVIPEEARLALGADAPLSEIERLEQIRDRFKITEEELNNSTDDELAASVRITQNAVGRLPEIPAIRANESLNRLREELLRRSQQPVESKAGKRMVVDKNTLTGIGNTTAATAFVSNTVNREIEGGLAVDLVNPVSGKVTRITGFDNTRRKLIGNDLKTKRRTSIPMGSILDGQSRLEIFNPKTARSRQDNEITEPVVRKFEPLVSPKELEVKATEEIKSTPLEGFESVEETKVEASRKANVLRELKAESPKDFLTNVARRGGIKQKVADLLIRSGGLENAAIKIGRFGRATDRNQRFAGKYNRVTNEITINLDERDSYTNEDGTHDVESTLLHELGHAAFANKLANKETLDPAESKAVREIESIYERFKERYNDTRADYSNNTQNAFNNLQEFGSEVLVNPELQNLVADLTPDKSLLQKVLQYILNFIQGKELNPYNELSQAWQALNTLTGRPAVTTEAEVTPTGEAELLSPALVEDDIDSINRMVLSEENIPAAESGILSKLLSASYEVKKLYNGLINQAFKNPKTKVDEIVDFIGKTYGIDLLNKKGAIAPSTFLNKITGIREFNPTNLITFTGPNARRNSMIYGLIRSIATKQNGTATYTKDNKGDKVGVRYNFEGAMTPNISKQVSDVINAVLVLNNAESASNDIALYPRANGIDVVHLGYDSKIDDDIRDDIFDELNKLNNHLTGRSNKVKKFNVTADYESNDWSKQTKGEKYYEEIDKLIREHPEYKEPSSIQGIQPITRGEEKIQREIQKGIGGSSRRRSDLLRRWMESRITPRINTINAGFAAKGYGNIGADYKVIKLNTPNGDAYIKYYPSAVNLPPLKELSSIGGELVALGEMDTQDADGITMGGGMYPFLKSNDVIVTDANGNSYRVVWANQGTTTKNNMKSKIQNETTNGYMVLHIMQPESQATNAQFFEGILNTVLNSDLSAPQIEAVKVISGVVSPRKSINKKANPNYKQEIADLKSLNRYVKALNKAGTDSKKINLINKRYSDKAWYKNNLEKFNNSKSTLDYIKNNTTFNGRGLAVGRLKNLMFLGDQIIDKLAQSSDFVNVPSLQLASVVQLSKRPEAFAVWTGKMDLNPTEDWTEADIAAYNDMTETEKDLRRQLINSGKFIAHKSYDWALLGPSDADNFIIKTPVEAEQAFSIELTGDRKELREVDLVETIDTKKARDIFAIKRGQNINIKVDKKIRKPVKAQPRQLQEVEADREQLAEEAGLEPLAPKKEKDLYSPATDVVKRIFPNTPKSAYTKDFKNWLLRLFTTGNRNQIVQKAVEWIEGKLNSYRFQMESVVKRLKTAAEKDGVNFDDVAEALNKALARNPDDLTEAQREEIDRIVLNAGNQAIEQFLNGTAETSPTGVNIEGVEFTLPEELKKSSPRYGMGKIQFFSDFDKAAYIIANNIGKLSKADAKFRKAIQDAGYDIDEVIEHGNKIKAELKKLAGGTAPRTAMNLDLLPQKFDGQSKPYTDRKVKSKSRELTDAELTQIQEAMSATGISPTEAAELVLGEQKFNRLKNYIATVKKQARIDAELEFNKQNLDRAYKEADDALNALPENLRNQILEARAEIREVTGGVVHNGVIPPNARVVIDGKKVNIAIKEAYYATLDENFIKKLKMDPERIDSLIQYAQDTWINNRANELINESLTDMSRKEAKNLATTELNRLTDEGEINLKDTIESFLNIAATNPTKGFEELLAPSLKMTPDQQANGLTKALKEALGRVDDNVGYTYISMMHNIAQEITYSEGFNMMRESGLRDGWVVDIASGDLIPEGFVPIEKSSIPGFSKAFEGMMVDPLFKQEIENTYDSGGKMDGIQKSLNGFNSFTLAAATSLSLPRGPLRNFLGNILFYISAGRIDPRPLAKGMKVAIAALQQSGDTEIIARLKRLIELNLIDQDVTMDILRNSVKGFKGEDINMLENLGQTLKPSNIAKVGKFLNRLYQLPDNMWKIALQIAEETTLTEAYKDGIPSKDAGTEIDIAFGTPEFKTKIEELAADRVKEAMPAYSRMNPIGRFFRKPGMRAFVAPFIGFRSEVLRLQISNLSLALRDSKSSNPVLRKSGFKRLAGITAAYSTLPIMAAMTKAIFGIGDDEEEAARRTLAPWDQNAELIFYRDKDRNLKYYNISFANPFAGSSTDAYKAARRSYEMNDEKGVKAMTEAIARGLWETFGAYVDPQIFTKKAIEAYSNVSDDGRPVYNPESGPGQIGWDIAGHLYSGLEPGTLKQGRGLFNAIMGKEDSRGEIPSVGPAIFNTFLVRSGDVRPAEAFKYKSLEINRRKRDAARIITSLVKRKGPVSEEEITTAYNQANEAYYSILSDAHRLYNDQLILGTNKREILTLLKEAGISGDEIQQIRRGYIKPYEISDTTLRVIPRDRARLVQKLYREQRRRLASNREVLTNPKGTNTQK